jgi:hypothetical protein
LALSTPAVADAHGLNVDDDPNRALIQYVRAARSSSVQVTAFREAWFETRTVE